MDDSPDTAQTSRNVRIGIDMGGTKIEVAALGAGGVELVRRRVATPRGDYDATVRTIRNLVLETEETLGKQATVGIGIPGAISPATGLVKNANSTWIIGRPLKRDLSTALERPVRLENDANCLAVSEAVDGAGADCPVVFAIILGTGVGGGIAIAGRALPGRQAIAGEWGHNPLPWPNAQETPGPACYCGKRGCIETFLCGPALAADYRAQSGTQREVPEIVQLAAEGDAHARAALERYLDRLARALSSVINLLDPDVVVLGGGLSAVDALYTQLPERLGAYVFSDHCDTPMRKAVHGDSSGVRGAAYLW